MKAIIFSLAFLGVALASCAHQDFETCLTNKLMAQLDARVKAAKVCSKDTDCLIQNGVADVLELKQDVEECKATLVDAGAGQ